MKYNQANIKNKNKKTYLFLVTSWFGLSHNQERKQQYKEKFHRFHL